ncbi:DUF1761 domain-containing protein [Fodinicola acaciae]|uniref:DUF1761 domain-containing protein n=1 Tax=Fodinicola acaciae TaxID=2681555 RepID=UPI0013D88E63|nr:DUF1761 domain-containing protein [Fodinicola acaciae]
MNHSKTPINYWAVLVAAAATLVTSSVYYVAFSAVWLSLRGSASRPSGTEIFLQCLQNLVIALALAYLLKWSRIDSTAGALRVGLVVWGGFQAMAIAGSVLHEQYPVGLYLLHSGDALIMTLLMALILGNWRRRPAISAQLSQNKG